jgi:hypothetical protein
MYFRLPIASAEAIIADHHAVNEFESLPDSIIQAIGEDFLIFYGHTSHGSQIMTGLDMLYEEDTLYAPPYFYEYGDDLGGAGDTTWVPPTRSFLNSHPDYNLVMWSWCGGVSDNTEEGINIYLNAMSQLEQDYPSVKFIFMTGHLDGTGLSGNLYARNNQIRAYCDAADKVLFDFADIESYDPDGNYYPDASDACEWCYTWCSSHPCPGCPGCAHSHCFNCYLKGKAWWWMMARISGWNPQPDTLPNVVSTTPTQNALNVPINSNISVTFDIDMDATTINDSTFVVNAWSTGLHQGTITYDSPTKTANLDPDSDFVVGEIVTVVLTTDIQSSQGVPLESSYVWSFTALVNDGSGTFLHDSVYSVGMDPRSISSADLDDDGDLDLATANDSSANVSVLLNKGDGTFSPHSVYPVGTAPVSLFSADLDGDGDMDLATANRDDDSVSVLLNNGYAIFDSVSSYPVGRQPESIFCADLDGDGDLDLTTANAQGHDVSVLLNNGDGTFTFDSAYPVGQLPSYISVGDFDRDADLDLATVNYSDYNVSVLLNNGDGTFSSHSDFPAGTAPWRVFSADLDEDGFLDLAIPNYSQAHISVLLGDSGGTFSLDSAYAVDSIPYSVFSGDLDGDGDLDLATSNWASGNVSVLLNNGDGTFAPHFIYPVGHGPESVVFGDLDGDGDLDLAVANRLDDNVSILFNCLPTGDCSHDDVVNIADVIYLLNYLFGGGAAPEPLEIGDVNCDGVVNIADVIFVINYLFSAGDPPGCC